MKKYICIGLLAAAITTQAAYAGPNDTEQMRIPQAYSNLVDLKGLNYGISISLTPHYFFSRNSAISGFDKNGVAMKSAPGHAKGGGISLDAGIEVNKLLTMSLLIQQSYMNCLGGLAVPDKSEYDGSIDLNGTSTIIGVTAGLNLKRGGGLSFMLMQEFSSFNGSEQQKLQYSVTEDKRSAEDLYGRAVSLTAWYEKPIELGSSWYISPYAGWRSVYSILNHQNNFEVPAEHKDAFFNETEWIHLVSGGTSFGFNRGHFGFDIRGGINYRVSSNPVLGYGNRIVAPRVVQYGNNLNFDRTVGTFGAGIRYYIADNWALSAIYDGFAGAKTETHSASVGVHVAF